MYGFGLKFWVEETGVMGHAVGPKFKAQNGSGYLGAVQVVIGLLHFVYSCSAFR